MRRCSRAAEARAATLCLAAALVAAACVPRPEPAILDVRLDQPTLQQTMAGIYAADARPEPPAHPIRAAVVPHHLTASESIAYGIRMLAGRKDRTIVLLSPDHFDRCPTLLCMTRADARTPLGEVLNAPDAAGILASSPLVTETDALFGKEHGVTAVLPFIAHYLPGARVTPLVISQRRSWREERDALRTLVDELSARGVTLVVSSDFSHYLPLQDADAADAETMRTLLSADLGGVAGLRVPDQSDCSSCLWMLTAAALDGGFFNPSVLLHTNSARLLGEPGIGLTTSHFAMAFYASDALDGSDWTFGGDVTVTRGDARPLPGAMRAFWAGEGPRVVNLEGPLASACTSAANPYLFCNPLERWRSIKDLATRWVIVNNHMFDLGEAGFRATQAALAAEGETAVGADAVGDGAVRLYAATLVMNPAEGVPGGWAAAQTRRVLDALRAAPAGGMDIVVVHAGTEYEALFSDADAQALRLFVDAGAEAVIALHSHVPGDMELYSGRPIFRGLGNLVFDQLDAAATRTSKAVRLRLEDGEARFQTLLAR